MKEKNKQPRGQKQTKFTYKEKTIIVSCDLYKILELLKYITANPSEAADKFYGINTLVSKTTESPDHDEVEKSIYLAIISYLTDDSPLSRYMKREFDIHQYCIPFLMGLRSPESVLKTISADPIFEPKLLGQVFRFLGDYGVKDEAEAWGLKEAKEAKSDDNDRIKHNRLTS